MNDELLDRIASNLMDALVYVNELRNGAIVPPDVTAPAVPVPGLSALTRLTAPDGGPLSHGYSTRDPWNLLHSGLVLEHSHGEMGLHDGKGAFFDMLPRIKPASPTGGGIIWDRHNKDLFYTTEGNELLVFDVAASWGTQPTLVHRFKQYGVVNIGGGEGTISLDGNYLPMIGDGTQPFLFGLKQNMIMDGPYSISGLNAVYVSTDNHLIATGLTGVQLLKPGPALIAYRQEHMDVGRDLDGTPIVVWLDDRNNAVTKIRLNDLNNPVPILKLGWSPKGGAESMACHICCPAHSLFAVVSTYGRDKEMPFADQILKVPLDGSAPTVLTQHHSDATGPDGYQGQPHAVGSGKQFLFDAREKGERVVYVGAL